MIPLCRDTKHRQSLKVFRIANGLTCDHAFLMIINRAILWPRSNSVLKNRQSTMAMCEVGIITQIFLECESTGGRLNSFRSYLEWFITAAPWPQNNSSRGDVAYHSLTHKQDGNERFYHSFSLVCQKSTPPTGREMNSPSAVSPESPLLFLIKTFLRLCTFFFFHFFSGGPGVGGGALLQTYSWWVTQWQRMYLDFTGLARKLFIPTCNVGVLCTAEEDALNCLCSHLSCLRARS